MGTRAWQWCVLGLASLAIHCGDGIQDAGDASSDATSDAHPKKKPFDSGLTFSDGPPGPCFPDAGAFSACPLVPPHEGDPCVTMQQECEYGTSFHPECDPVFICDCGKWSLQWDGVSSCPFNAQGCPATLADVDASSVCPAQGESCDYGTTQCDCSGGCGGGALSNDAPPGAWLCVSQDITGVCPWPRPRIGTACGPNDHYCPYTPGCCPGWDMACFQGVWAGLQSGPCP